jgi:molybdopterin-dependent oxidoreductase alpha subunit
MTEDTKQNDGETAGGWAALASSAKHMLQSGKPLGGVKTLLRLNQDAGFDCPGCAWGDPEHASSFEFCENGVKAVAWESTKKTVGPDFFARYSVSELKEKDAYFLEGQGRLVHPMRYDRATDHYRPVSWEAAFKLIGDELGALASPNEALFYTSGRTSNEAAFLYQLFVRAFGTNNLPDCSNMCHEPSGVALTESIGIGKGTVRLEDFELADAIFVFGQNPGTNHPRMLGDLRKAALRGAAIVTFNPLKERGLVKFADPKQAGDMLGGGVNISSHYMQVRPGGDRAVAKGLMKQVLAADRASNGGVIDHGFIKDHTDGYAALIADLDATEWSEIEFLSGLTQKELSAVGDVYIQAEKVIFTWAMGITQQPGAVDTIQTMLNLLMLRGNIGRPGAGVCPVRGHSNVQGDRTMGITEQPKPAFLDALDKAFGIVAPRVPGFNTIEAIKAMAEGRAKVFIGMGGNFASATPDTTFTEAAIARCKLTAHVSTKLNRSHLICGDEALILPCLGRTEIDIQAAGDQIVTVEDSMSMVHGSAGMNPPVSELLMSEPAIVAGIARAALPQSVIDWEKFAADYSEIRAKIADVVPGFENFNQRIEQPNGFYLGNSAGERRWVTDGGKARFRIHPLVPVSTEAPTEEGHRVFTLITVRSHDQYNTTVYGLNDRYRGVKGERRVLFINASDMKLLGFNEGERVNLRSLEADGKERVAPNFKLKVHDIPSGSIAAYYPETNVLLSVDSVDARSGTPASKRIPVTLHSID